MLHSLTSWFCSRRAHGPRALASRLKRTRCFQLQLEPLEERQLLSAAVTLSSGVLSIVADNSGSSVILDHSPGLPGAATTVQVAGAGTFSFADSAFSRIEMDGGGGSDHFLVRAIRAPLTIKAGSGQTFVNLGGGSTLEGFDSTVNVENYTLGYVDLKIDDSGETSSTVATLYSNRVENLAPNPIEWGYLNELTIQGGAGGIYNVVDTPYLTSGDPTRLVTANGATSSPATVNVAYTSGPLLVDAGGGANTVNVGNTSLGNNNAIAQAPFGLPLYGALTIKNTSGRTNLNVDDSLDLHNHELTVSANGLSSTDFSSQSILPAGIFYDPTSLSSLNFHGGAGNMTYDVESTPGSATLVTGNGTDLVNAHAASGTLSIQTGTGNTTINVGSDSTTRTTSADTISAVHGLIVHGGTGTTHLSINDQGNTTPRTFGISANNVATNNGPVAIIYVNVQSVAIYGGSGGNTFNIVSTAPGTSMVIDTGSGLALDHVHVGAVVHSVQNIKGSLTLIDGTPPLAPSGLTSFHTIVNPAATQALAGSLASPTSGSSSFRVVQNTTIANLGLNSGPTLVTSGTGTTPVLTGSGTASGSVPVLTTTARAGLNFAVQPGQFQLDIDDSADPGKTTATFDVSGGLATISGLAPATISYSATTASGVTVHGGQGDENLTVNADPVPLTLLGGGGNNTLTGSSAAGTWTISGTNAGTLSSAAISGGVTFSKFANLTGGSGGNVFHLTSGGSITGMIDGGGGVNQLDYSALTTNVYVNLQTHQATAVGGSVLHFKQVTGGSGGPAGSFNILVGDGGDRLVGGNGRQNLLIAGATSSTLIGGNEDDILIGGSTLYDLNVNALDKIMAEWCLASESYTTKVNNLLNGTGLSPILNKSTVFDNGGGNWLQGHGGSTINQDLYYGLSIAKEAFSDNAATEQFIQV